MIHDDGPDSAMDAPSGDAGSECGRRSLLRGAVVLGAVGIGGALSRIGAGASGGDAVTVAQGTSPIAKPGSAEVPAKVPKKPAPGTPKAPAKGKALAPTSQIPVGGGVVFEKAGVVITQPTAGEFKAFDATCTHEKCFLADVSGGTINCACHGAKFSITDGTVQSFFPITDDLPAKGTVTVAGGKVVWAT